VPSRFGGEEVVARHNEIARGQCRPESLQPFRVVKAFGRVRVSQPDGIIEVEHESADAATQQRNRPAWEELSLKDDGVGVPKTAAKRETAEGASGK